MGPRYSRCQNASISITAAKERQMSPRALVPALVLVALAGCGPVYIRTAPPPLRMEVIEGRPGVEFVWIAGYWGWHHDDYDWVPGHWIRRPHPESIWVPGFWRERPHRGWQWVP